MTQMLLITKTEDVYEVLEIKDMNDLFAFVLAFFTGGEADEFDKVIHAIQCVQAKLKAKEEKDE